MASMMLGYVGLVVLTIPLLMIDYLIRHSFFSIFFFFTIPYLAIEMLHCIVCRFFNFMTPSFDYWFTILGFLTVMLIADLFAWKCARYVMTFQKNKNDDSNEKKEKMPLLDVVTLALVAYSMFHFWTVYKKYNKLIIIVQQKFQDEYASGKNFYVRVFLMLLVVYYLGGAALNKRNLLIGAIGLLPNVLTFVKGIILLPLLASILLRIKNKDIKISIKTVMFFAFVGGFVFFGVYALEMAIYDKKQLGDLYFYKQIAGKLIIYLVSGVQSFTQNFSSNRQIFLEMDNVTLTPIINLLSKIGIGHGINNVGTVYQKFEYINLLGRRYTSNVNGYIGTLYLYNGFFFGNVINAFQVFLSSFLLELFGKKKSMMTYVSMLYCISFCLGWFEYYFVHTFWTYLLVFGIVMSFLMRFRIKVSIKRKNG